MTKSQKIYEALAILAQAQSPLFMRFFSLKLSKANVQRLKPFSEALVRAFEDMENELLKMKEELK